MKRTQSLLLAIATLALFTVVTGSDALSQAQGKPADRGDARQYGPIDLDGDGIPNCLDPDFVKPADGSGRKLGKMGLGRGYGDGSGNCGIGPRNGSGFGPGSGTCTGTGPGSCDGSGPKGKGGRR
jgi:hypothetical protein